jgi:2-hydroxy-4-(methylsulfanyl)butanoate S-methyltransferase
MTTPPARPETIERLSTIVYPSFAMLAGMELDLFTPLKDGPLTVEQLAAALEVRADKLQPLLYALVVAGLLEVEGERFANTPEAHQFLVRGKPGFRGGTHVNVRRRWDAILKTAESIRTGEPRAPMDFSSMSADGLEAFYRGNQLEAAASGRYLAAHFDFSSCRTLVDIAGGSGALAVALTEACPGLRATVVDLPSVTPITQRLVEEAGAADRVQVVTADVVNGPPPGSYDAAVMKSFVQILGPEDARRALTNVGQVVQPGGVLYIEGSVLEDSRLSPLEMVVGNLQYLNYYHAGAAYTEREHRTWLAQAGFTEGFERLLLPSQRSIIRVRKPG